MKGTTGRRTEIDFRDISSFKSLEAADKRTRYVVRINPNGHADSGLKRSFNGSFNRDSGKHLQFNTGMSQFLRQQDFHHVTPSSHIYRFDDRTSYRVSSAVRERLSAKEFTPYTIDWFKRWGKALTGDKSPLTQEWQNANRSSMFREKAFLDGFHASYLERQNYRFSSLFSLPSSNNPYLRGSI